MNQRGQLHQTEAQALFERMKSSVAKRKSEKQKLVMEGEIHEPEARQRPDI